MVEERERRSGRDEVEEMRDEEEEEEAAYQIDRARRSRLV
jgi:hypothetical protein